MTILIPYLRSPLEEIRYAIRSICMFQEGEIIVAGDVPEWFSGRSVRRKQNSATKQMNVVDNIKAAWPLLDDDFIVWYDDLYQLRDGQVNNTHLCTLGEALNLNLSDTVKEMIRNNLKVHPSGCYHGNHRPFVVNKERFISAMDVDWSRNYVWKSLYLNNVRTIYADDCKVRDESKIEAQISSGKYLSTHNISKKGLKRLSELYPNKSKYEL